MAERNTQAVVIGASMGGLLAARALADHFGQVTLLERDRFPAYGEGRKGVPQGRHVHALLARGRLVLEGFFPGLTEEMARQSAIVGGFGADTRWFEQGGYVCKYESNLQAILMSRGLLESELRRRVLELPNVRAIEQCDVLGLTATADNARVTGVRLMRRADGSAEEALDAELVVDTSGRGSRMPRWLEALGYEPPAEERVRIDLHYSTRIYRRRPTDLDGDVAAVVVSSADDPGGAVMTALENDRWIVTLACHNGVRPPTEAAAFIEHTRSLSAPDIYNVIRSAEPLTEPATYAFLASQRRRYEDLARFPEGLLVTSDAICSFNPVYGQGMTVATQEALALDECLHAGDEQLAKRFFKAAAEVVDAPWQIAVGGDLRFPHVEGERTRATRFINWYLGRLRIAARHDPAVADAYGQVINLMQPPPSLMRPPIAARVLWGNLRRRSRQPAAEPLPAHSLARG
jgi:2-polyprenyl-6-methoxyphenol hydroxylase-like FAD-dependent oxidoreductase